MLKPCKCGCKTPKVQENAGDIAERVVCPQCGNKTKWGVPTVFGMVHKPCPYQEWNKGNYAEEEDDVSTSLRP